jgi:hypothetical protein
MKRNQFWSIQVEEHLVRKLEQLYEKKQTRNSILCEWKRRRNIKSPPPPLLINNSYHRENLKKDIDKTINDIFSSFDFNVEKEKNFYTILDTEADKANRKQLLKQKQIDMCQGHLWQKVFGCMEDITDLGKGHYTGLDLYSEKRRLYFEIKNSYHTDNSCSRKRKEQLLCQVKKQYPDHTCIYGVVNDTTSKKVCKTIQGVEIWYVSGDELFQLVFGNHWKEMVCFVQSCYEKYRNSI